MRAALMKATFSSFFIYLRTAFVTRFSALRSLITLVIIMVIRWEKGKIEEERKAIKSMIMTTMTTIIIVAIIISNGINGVYTDNNYRYYFYYWGRIIRRMGTLRTFAGCSLIKEARNRGRFSMRVLREPLVMRKSEPPLLSFPHFVRSNAFIKLRIKK